jgi:hypothetical protein
MSVSRTTRGAKCAVPDRPPARAFLGDAWFGPSAVRWACWTVPTTPVLRYVLAWLLAEPKPDRCNNPPPAFGNPRDADDRRWRPFRPAESGRPDGVSVTFVQALPHEGETLKVRPVEKWSGRPRGSARLHPNGIPRCTLQEVIRCAPPAQRCSEQHPPRTTDRGGDAEVQFGSSFARRRGGLLPVRTLGVLSGNSHGFPSLYTSLASR